MRWICNPREETAFKRLIQMLPGIAAKGADKLWRLVAPPPAPSKPSPFQKALQSSDPPRAAASLASQLAACANAVPKKARDHWPQLVETIRQIDTPDMRQKPSLMIQTLLEAGYEDHLKTSFDNYRSRLEDIREMASYSSKFESLDRFLAELALLTNADSEDNSDPKENAESRVRLSTIHQAKGLEFDVVFVIMLCEGLFPSAKSLKSPAQEEEERRLFYVASTRARNELYLTWPVYRAAQGASPADAYRTASRFLDEIPSHLREKQVLPGGF
jgi:DNA helicase-2/ATP-dependent DNA helicase PcrA